MNQPIWAVFKELPLVWGLAVDSILGGLSRCETTAWLCNWKQGPPAERQASLPYLFNYRSLDINSQILVYPNRWKRPPEEVIGPDIWYWLTQNTLNILRGWCFHTSAGAQDDHSAQNTIFTGQKGWAWTSRAKDSSGMTKHAINMTDGTCSFMFCNLIHQTKENTWIRIRQNAFYSNYINRGENKSFLSSHVQLWPIQTTESNYAVLVCLFYLADCSANNVLLHLYGQVFGTLQVNCR